MISVSDNLGARTSSERWVAWDGSERVALLRFAERFVALQQTAAQRDAVYFGVAGCQIRKLAGILLRWTKIIFVPNKLVAAYTPVTSTFHAERQRRRDAELPR